MNNRFPFKSLAFAFFLLMTSKGASAKPVTWFDGIHAVSLSVPRGVDPVVDIASDMFSDDMKQVTGIAAQRTGLVRQATIRLCQLDRLSRQQQRELRDMGVPVEKLQTLTDGFHICVLHGQIVVVGANGRGTAYGLLELSRLAGVSPWIWWGDIVPEHRSRLTIGDQFTTTQGASVEFRGIFLNDEDWSLRPWSYARSEKTPFGVIGKNTYKKVFQLLLRLRANAIWPAMHPGTEAFFLTPGAKAMADSCGIAIGSSHCEPLLRNNVGEWNEKVRGAFNYITNRQAVQDYWAERLKEVKDSKGGNLLTIGMRGIHDGSMLGVKTMKEKFDALQLVIDDQQKLIAKYLGDPKKQAQVFIPYKEVLDIYNMGLRVPDNVTLMWCDDNYGYMTRLSDGTEQRRVGGGGVYYHLSYWGRPHDYLWLATTQPGFVYNEMRTAYDHNVRKMWIVNVHDPKVAGYDLELFLDMAWNIDCVNGSTLNNHYREWLCRQFGKQAGDALFPAMYEYFRLCGERRPEFMGWNQTELSKDFYDRGLSPVRNSEFSQTEFGDELDGYLARFAAVAERIRKAKAAVRPELQDAYFAAIEYPVCAAEAHARKMLWAQKARLLTNGTTTKDMFAHQSELYHACAESQQAYQEVRALTEYYNEKMAGGKWRWSMNMRPRDLPVFGAPVLPMLLTDAQILEWLKKGRKSTDRKLSDWSDTLGVVARNAADWQHASPCTKVIEMLGHSMRAVALPQGGDVTYVFSTDRDGDCVLRVALIPTQPNDKGDLRFSVSIDGGQPTMFSLKEPFRSERWKRNVLRGQAVRELPLKGLKAGRHTLTIHALDPHIVLDQWMVDSKANRRFYLFPVRQTF
ncbi:glycosyl hydrolase 115 family protein [Hallella absiana]|uniref:glycosyl hydrolase 115 family protein n=1 Tax=Hallella absiana TaxID=2925336 RepID=UPI0021CA59E2|nr:glycosyl hydrolase 115 family protein [Hallella absiana]